MTDPKEQHSGAEDEAAEYNQAVSERTNGPLAP
jgi:hypothetical protein